MFLEDCGLIGAVRTTAVVGRSGAIDWRCVGGRCSYAIATAEAHATAVAP